MNTINPRTQNIRVGLSDAFTNKDLNRGYTRAAFGNSFTPSSVTVGDLTLHIENGRAWTQGNFESNKRSKDTFASAQTLSLDLDDDTSVDDALAHVFIRDYAALVHPSPSSRADHRKTRVVFVLDQPVTDRARWEAMQRGLISHFADLQPDDACKDAARLFFGSTNTTDRWYKKPSKRLPLTIAGALTLDEAYADDITHDLEKTRDESPQRVKIEGSRAEKYAAATLTKRLDDLGATYNGRHDALLKTGTFLFGAAASGDWPGIDAATVERGLHDAMTRNGYRTKVGDREIQRNIDDTRSYGVSSPIPLELSPSTRNSTAALRDWTPVEEPRLDNIIRVAVKYIADAVLPVGDLLIKSDMGTGKSTWGRQQAKDVKRVLIVVHRQSLARTVAKQYSATCYLDVEGQNLAEIDRLAISYNSLHKLSASGELPSYDLVIIDEIEQGLDHLRGDTFHNNESDIAYQHLIALVRNAGRLLAFDAHANRVSRDFLDKYRDGKVSVVVNDYIRQRGRLTMHAHDDKLLKDVMDILDKEDDVTIAIPTSSIKLARDIEAIVAREVGHDAVLTINSQNSGHERQQAFLEAVGSGDQTRQDEAVRQYRVIIHTSSMGSGVDIQTPIRLVAGIFLNEPLPAAECHQMLERWRERDETWAYVQQPKTGRDEDVKSIYSRYVENAKKTASRCNLNAFGVRYLTDEQQALCGLASRCEAATNRSLNNLYDHFMTLAQGYEDIVYIDDDDKKMTGELIDAREARGELKMAMALGADQLTDEEFEALLQKGREGKLTDTDRAAMLRYQIEYAAGGQELTERLYKLLHKSSDRAALRLLRKVAYEGYAELDRLDRLDGEKSIHRRDHVRRKVEVMRRILRDVFANDRKGEVKLTKDQIEELLDDLFETHGEEIRLLFNRRKTASTNTLPLLRGLLSKIGLTLAYEQVRIDGEQVRVYYLDPVSMNEMLDLARAQQDAVEQARAASLDDFAYTLGVSQNLHQDIENTTDFVTDASAHYSLPQQDDAVDPLIQAAIELGGVLVEYNSPEELEWTAEELNTTVEELQRQRAVIF